MFDLTGIRLTKQIGDLLTPDLSHWNWTKHPHHSLGRTLYSKFGHRITPGIIVKFADLFRNILVFPRSPDPTLESDEASGIWLPEQSLESIIATDALRSRRSVALRENGIDAPTKENA
jgi:hypothetical protein